MPRRSETLTKALELMDQLNPSELTQLRAKAALLTRSPDAVRGEVDFLADGIRNELVVRGLWGSGQFIPIKKLAPDYHSAGPAVWNDLLAQAGGALWSGVV
jgi:hypothetical protein